MPRKLRYTEALGLNARGLEKYRRQRSQVRKIAANQVPLSIFDKSAKNKKKVHSQNEYWDQYNAIMQKFENLGLKEFLTYQSQSRNLLGKNPITKKQRNDLLNKLRQELIKIEKLKYQYSVSVPSKTALKILTTLCSGRQCIQILTSNHGNHGYWAYLLSQKSININVYRAPNVFLDKSLNNIPNGSNNSNNNGKDSDINMTGLGGKKKNLSNKNNLMPKYKVEKYKKMQNKINNNNNVKHYHQWFTVQNEFNLYRNVKSDDKESNKQSSVASILNPKSLNENKNGNMNSNNNNKSNNNNGMNNSVMLMVYPDFKQDSFFIDAFRKGNNKRNDNNDNEMNGNASDNNDNANINQLYEVTSVVECYGSLLGNNDNNGSKNNNNNGLLPSVQCLKHFKGEYVVHIGELFGATFGTNPWGRTSSMEFQIELNKKYHKIFEMELPRWPMMRDTLSIWKRNDYVKIGNEMLNLIDLHQINDVRNTPFMSNIIKKHSNKNNNISNRRIVDENKSKSKNKK